MTRTEAREIAYKMIFSNQFLNNGFDMDSFLDMLDGAPFSEKDLEFVQGLVDGVKDKLPELKELISHNLSEYKYDRLFSADKVALLLCVYELKFCADTPHKVAINEALNLVKKYSTDKSAGFVNSVIDKIYKEITAKNE